MALVGIRVRLDGQWVDLPASEGSEGPPGADGADGADGASAYDLAVAGGFVGTEAEWLATLVGPEGPAGESGDQGPAGTDGADGAEGPQGPPGVLVKVWDGDSYVDVSGTSIYVGGPTDPTVADGDIWIETA